ncbi:MAG: glycosyltransferase family 2 protein [Candidatus Hodarchaeota archaeon]
MDLSIVIVNWNTKKLLKNCLESLYQTINTVNFEVIVVDNGSKDGSKEMVQKTFPQVKLIANSTNLGFSAADNQGIKVSHGKYLMFLNSDTLVLPLAIDEMIEFISQRPQVGVVGCRLLYGDGTPQESIGIFHSVPRLLLHSLYIDKLFPQLTVYGAYPVTHPIYHKLNEVEVIKGCAMVVRREALNEIGLFDERFFLYSEETDLSYRIRKAGWKIYFYPYVKIIHYGERSTRMRASWAARELERSLLKFIKKHYGKRHAVVAKALLISHCLLAFIILPMKTFFPGRFRKEERSKFSDLLRVLKWRWTL